MKRGGFTLIEVMIAMVILSFLSLFTVEAIKKALQTKQKVQKDIDKSATVRDALRIMERDINMAFNYRDINIALYNMTQKQRQKDAQTKNVPGQTQNTPGQPNPPTTPGQPPGAAAPVDPNKYKLKTEKIATQFIGEPHALSFTSLSNVRMMEESPISSQAEIGYELKPCRRRSTQEQSSQCLWRRVANYIHDDITKDGQLTVMLENVTEFKLRYLGPGREDEWIDTWITNERGDSQTQGKFPYAVEITLEVKDPTPQAKDKPLRLTAVAAIRNPNNPKDDSKDVKNADGTTTPQPDQDPSAQTNGAQTPGPSGATTPPAAKPITQPGH
jgi:prepilin-type N-terminal cleavage/methylation domain-containing protein